MRAAEHWKLNAPLGHSVAQRASKDDVCKLDDVPKLSDDVDGKTWKFRTIIHLKEFLLVRWLELLPVDAGNGKVPSVATSRDSL